jgi:predicted RNA-binding Zn-ribbon protein involved in translation (DUF1610 family)
MSERQSQDREFNTNGRPEYRRRMKDLRLAFSCGLLLCSKAMAGWLHCDDCGDTALRRGGYCRYPEFLPIRLRSQ